MCKVLAELQFAGEELGLRCARWGYAEFSKAAPGRALRRPVLRIRTERVTLPRRHLDLAECERQVRELEAALREAEGRYAYPYPPNQKRKFLLRGEDEPLWEIMDLQARLSRWSVDLKRARSSPMPPVETVIGVLRFDEEVCALCCPMEVHHKTMRKIRERSPFPVTLMFGYVTYPGEVGVGSYITTRRKLDLGGYHADVFAPEAEEVIIESYLELLHDARSQGRC